MDGFLHHPGFTVVRIPSVRSFSFALMTITLAAGSGTVTAQFGTVRRSLPGRFIEAPRSVQQQLREAERALEDERYSDAVVRLGDLLASEAGALEDTDLSGQDFFLGIKDKLAPGVPVTQSFMRTARAMIGTLPAAALETYELRYGPLARKMLEDAASTRDWTKVREVRRKYFHTLAGYDASLLLAQHEMFGGHPLAASLLLDEVVAVPRAVDRLGKSVLLFHAAACELSGREFSETALANGAGEVEIAGETEAWPRTAELTEWLAEHFGTLETFVRGQLANYSMYGAQPNRNGAASGQLPLTNLRWSLDTTASPRQERAVRQVSKEMITSGKLPPPSWVPLRVGNQLLMRTSERLVGVDYQTGKRVWTYPWQAGYEEVESEESVLDGMPGESGPSDLLSQRVWNDVPYGQITSDGERVYLLDDLKKVEAATYGSIRLRGTRPADTGSNTLVALDLATEGKLRWRLGAGSDEASTLSDAFFLGPPLPLDGRLYVMAELAGDINLCCLDPATGDEIWRQQLVAVESGAIDVDPIRRVAGAMPTFHEGVLICPTGAGAIVAIDLGDRTLRWGVNFDRNTEMTRSIGGRGRVVETKQLMQRWFTGAAIASGRSVLVTPIEADRLFGFDLLTGEPLFPEKNRVHMRYLAGIRGDRFYVVGSGQVRAFDLQTGKSVWTSPRDMLSAGQQISGHGIFGDTNYFVPTSSNQIISLSLEDGVVVDRRSTSYPLGNLVAADGDIISQGVTSLSVAFGEKTLEPLVKRMLKEDPNNFDAIVRKSELLIQRGRRSEALELLQRAREMQPSNDEVRMLSVSAMLGTLRENMDGDVELAETLSELIDRPTQRVELLSLRIRSALKVERLEEAADLLAQLSALVVSESLLESAAEQVVDDPGRQCSLDGWISGRVHELASVATPSQLKAINGTLRASMEAKREGSSNLLKRLARHFGALDGIEPVRQELAKRMLKEGAYLELERLALGARIPTTASYRELPTDRLAMLANAYVAGKMPRNAMVVLDELKTRDLSEQGSVTSENVEALRVQAQGQMVSVDWPAGASLQWDSRVSRGRAIADPQKVYSTQVLAGPEFDGWRLMGEPQSNIALRDPNGLLRRVPVLVQPDVDKEAQVSGGAMIVVTPQGLLGIDLYHLGDGEALLWDRSPSGDSGPVAKRRSTVTPFDDQVVRYYITSSSPSNVIPEFKLGPVMGDRVFVLQGGELLAIDVCTNDTIWQNSTAPKSGSVVCDGEQVAVVSSSTDEVVLFDLRDGRKIGTRPWKHGVVWGAAGSNVICYQETGEKRMYEVKLVNPFTSEVILRHETQSANRSNSDETLPSGYGRVVGGRYLVMLNNEGEGLLWDIRDGVELGRPQLPAYPDLQGLQVMMLKDQVLMLPKRRIKSLTAQARKLQTTDGSFHRTIHGLFAVSLKDGSLQWSKPLEEPWGCTLTQPANTPLLLLSRSPFVYTTPSRRKSLDVMAIDTRDGSVLDLSEGKPIESSNTDLETRMVVQPTLARVIAKIGTGQALTYTFGASLKSGDGEQAVEGQPAIGVKQPAGEKAGQGGDKKDGVDAGKKELVPVP